MSPQLRRAFAPTVAAAALAAGALIVPVRAQSDAPSPTSAEAATLRKIYSEALTRGEAFENLRTLVTQAPGRLAGSKSLDRAIAWGQQTLTALKLDRVYE